MLMLVFSLLAMQMPHHSHTDAVPSPCKPNERSSCTAHRQTATEKVKPVLQESIHNGRYLRLSDESLWEIHPKDTPITQSWITPVEIIASPSEDPDYPFKLTNSLTGTSVLARPASFTKKAPIKK
jgi:hypothetical protein